MSDSPVQPAQPRISQRGRNFEVRKYKERPWLEYSHIKNAGFCFCCTWFGGVKSSLFSTGGWTNFRHSERLTRVKIEERLNKLLLGCDILKLMEKFNNVRVKVIGTDKLDAVALANIINTVIEELNLSWECCMVFPLMVRAWCQDVVGE